MIIYNLGVLVDFYKHKYSIPVTDHEYNTKYDQNVNLRLLNCHKVFRQKTVLYTSLDL